MSVTIWHNPRCSKSRQALALIRERGIEPTVVEYLKTPPDAATIKATLKKLGLKPRDLLRRKEATCKAHGLDDPDLPDDAIIAAMVADPVLIERPVVISGGKAVLGRPAEAVLEIL